MKTNKPRGKRQSKFIPGESSHNLYAADHAHIPGDSLVSGEASFFFGTVKTYSDLMKLRLTKNNEVVKGKFAGSRHRVISDGYNAPLMQFFRMNEQRVDQIPTAIAFDICEQVLRAIQNRDGSFFNDLARLCESEASRPNISLDYWLTLLHWNYGKGMKTPGQQYHFTAPELCKLAALRGFKYGQGETYPVREMARICDRLGIARLNGRKGEKKKSDFNEIFQKLKSPQPITINLPDTASKKGK